MKYFCYCCNSLTFATHAIELKQGWQTVCEFHKEEAIEEETDGIRVRTIENHQEVMKRGKDQVA